MENKTKSTSSLSDAGSVIIVGGGIAGCSTAYYLAEDGVPVTLLEQHEIGGQASGANAGSLHAQISPLAVLDLGESWARGFAPAVPLFVESMRLWVEADAALPGDLEVSLCGGLVVAATAAEMRMLESKMRLDRAAGLDMEMLDAEGIRERAPYVSERLIGGLFCPIEGKANPLVAAPAFAAAAQSLGARIETGCPVTAIRRSRGKFEVETPRGGFRAARLVNAAGVGASSVATLAGAALHDEPYSQQLIVTERTEPLIDCLIYAASARLTLKQTKTGTIVIGGGWPARPGNRGFAHVLPRSLANNLGIALQAVPTLASLRVARAWAAEVNASATWRPLIGELPGVPGLFANWVPLLGFSGALAASRIVASLVQGRSPPVDFEISHFAP